MILTGKHTGSSPNSPHASSPIATAVDGRLDAKMGKNWGQNLEHNEMIIIQPDGLHVGNSANMPVATPVGTAPLI